MNVLRRWVLAAALVSSAAMAQEVSVDGKDFLSGAGDAKLADIARQAASQGKHVVVTAPTYWQSKIAAKLHAGAANVDVQMKEGFFENVVVRIEDGKAKADAAAAEAKAAAAKVETQKAEAARAEAARLEAARAEAERAETTRQETARAEAARAESARQEAARQDAARAEATRAEAAKAEAARQEAAKAAAAKAKAEKDAADKLAAQKKAMLQNLNGGHDADGTITAAQLQKDDQVFVDGQFRAIVRRGGARSQMYWLDGDLNLDRVELVPLGDNHYKVSEPIRENVPVVLRSKSATGHFVGNVPAPDAADRKSLEQQYAEGKAVAESIHPTDLRAGDLVYTAKSAAIVVRLQGTTYLRYWLDGDLNLGQAGLQKQGANAYRVISDTIR